MIGSGAKVEVWFWSCVGGSLLVDMMVLIMMNLIGKSMRRLARAESDDI